jgi:hypothetical protein
VATGQSQWRLVKVSGDWSKSVATGQIVSRHSLRVTQDYAHPYLCVCVSVCLCVCVSVCLCVQSVSDLKHLIVGVPAYLTKTQSLPLHFRYPYLSPPSRALLALSFLPPLRGCRCSTVLDTHPHPRLHPHPHPRLPTAPHAAVFLAVAPVERLLASGAVILALAPRLHQSHSTRQMRRACAMKRRHSRSCRMEIETGAAHSQAR